MNDWVDLTEIIPGLDKGQWLHVVNSPSVPLKNKLTKNGFSVYVIDGSEITDSVSFFTRVKDVFGFPEYFNGGWAAWDDCLGDFASLLNGKTAIIWDCADKTFMSDAKTFMQAVFDLYNLALTAGDIDQPDLHQVELFLIGNTEGFTNKLDFS
jgi:Barstar (barnase inhibitor)